MIGVVVRDAESCVEVIRLFVENTLYRQFRFSNKKNLHEHYGDYAFREALAVSNSFKDKIILFPVQSSIGVKLLLKGDENKFVLIDASDYLENQGKRMQVFKTLCGCTKKEFTPITTDRPEHSIFFPLNAPVRLSIENHSELTTLRVRRFEMVGMFRCTGIEVVKYKEIYEEK